MDIQKIDHINICTDDLERCVRFYRDVLGFERGHRPPDGKEGAWLYGGGVPLIHATAVGAARGDDTGAVDHIAFTARDYEASKRSLEEAGVAFGSDALPERRIRQLFVDDPDGVTVELTFYDDD